MMFSSALRSWKNIPGYGAINHKGRRMRAAIKENTRSPANVANSSSSRARSSVTVARLGNSKPPACKKSSLDNPRSKLRMCS